MYDSTSSVIHKTKMKFEQINTWSMWILKRRNCNYDCIALQSDKNNGIVFANKNWWLDFNEKYLYKQNNLN